MSKPCGQLSQIFVAFSETLNFNKTPNFQESMEKFGCTTPFGYHQDNICKDNTTGKQALDLFHKLLNKRHFIEECLYPCEFLKLFVISVHGRDNEDSFKLDFNQYIKV